MGPSSPWTIPPTSHRGCEPKLANFSSYGSGAQSDRYLRKRHRFHVLRRRHNDFSAVQEVCRMPKHSAAAKKPQIAEFRPSSVILAHGKLSACEGLLVACQRKESGARIPPRPAKHGPREAPRRRKQWVVFSRGLCYKNTFWKRVTVVATKYASRQKCGSWLARHLERRHFGLGR